MAGGDFELKAHTKKRKWIHFPDIILHEDDHILVANKPSGVASLDERDDDELNLLRLARRYHADLRLCHRLDKYTSGVIVFAKGEDNYRDLALQFEDRSVTKHYVAVIHGARKFEEYPIDGPISVTARGKVKIDFSAGKPALTVIDTAEMFRDFTVLDCQPMTGRMHQIRIHLASIGCPIVGDKDYGGKDIFLSDMKKDYKPNRKQEETPLNDHYMLHARGILFRHPGTKEEVSFVCPLSEKFEVLMKILRKYNVA